MMIAIVGPMTMSGSASASPDQIYKSVDKAGKVTYSTAPLADAVTTKMVEPPHQPTPEQVSAAEEQYQLVKTLGAELEQNRKQREEELARKMAEEMRGESPLLETPEAVANLMREHNRLRRVEGQSRGLQRMIEQGRPCEEIFTQLAATKAALDRVGVLLISLKMRECLNEEAGDAVASPEAVEKALEAFLKYARCVK